MDDQLITQVQQPDPGGILHSLLPEPASWFGSDGDPNFCYGISMGSATGGEGRGPCPPPQFLEKINAFFKFTIDF